MNIYRLTTRCMDIVRCDQLLVQDQPFSMKSKIGRILEHQIMISTTKYNIETIFLAVKNYEH